MKLVLFSCILYTLASITTATPNLLQLAVSAKGSKLSNSESVFIKDYENGIMSDFRENDPKIDDPDSVHKWSSSRIIDAALINWLCTNNDIAKHFQDGFGIIGAKITGQIVLSKRQVPMTLIFDQCVFTDEILLDDAHITILNLEGSHIKGLSANNLVIDNNILLCDGFKANGKVNLSQANIGHDLLCNNSTFNFDGEALCLKGIKVKGNALLMDCITTNGSINLMFADINGGLYFDGAFLKHTGGNVIVADGINVNGSANFRDNFKAEGVVKFISANIKGDFDCSGGSFRKENGYSIILENATINRILFCNKFYANGLISLYSAVCSNLIMTNCVIDSETVFSLMETNINVLHDDTISWPENGNLWLNGVILNKIDERSPTDANGRIAWLRKNPTSRYSPQPYIQIATVLERQGYNNDANKILIAKETDRLKYASVLLPIINKPLLFLYGIIIDYGYNPSKALFWFILFFIIGCIVYRIGFPKYFLETKNRPALFSSSNSNNLDYPKFNPIIYSLESQLPIVNFNHKEYWAPTGWFLIFYWFQVIVGWVLSTLIVISLTNLVK